MECVLCNTALLDKRTFATLTEKGAKGINKASEDRQESLNIEPGQNVHIKCRSNYCNSKNIASFNRKKNCTYDSSAILNRSLRSPETSFTYDKHCLFCGRSSQQSQQKTKQHKNRLNPVRTLQFQENILQICQRRKDTWSLEVASRIEFTHDLPAADAVYHQSCSVNFRTGKSIPQLKQTKTLNQKKGRPHDKIKNAAFLKVMDFLSQNTAQQHTIQTVTRKMSTFLPKTCKPYSFPHMKSQLLKHFGKQIIITEVSGRENVISFKTNVSVIMQDFFDQPRKKNAEEEKQHLIETAAKLIKEDIKSITSQKDSYPSTEQMTPSKALEYIPGSITTLLGVIFTEKEKKLKIASIGQAIMQAGRPRTLTAPLQLGLAVQMHHQFASKFLIETLFQLGFCSSYSEVQKYERSAATTQGTDLDGFDDEQFVQYVADNVDHNIRNLDGLNTFHGMGIIASVTPSIRRKPVVPRKTISAEDLSDIGRINILPFTSCNQDTLQSMTYEALVLMEVRDETDMIDLLWKVSWPLKNPRPAWSGMMQMVHEGEHPSQASTTFLPMIDMNPSDTTCVYSTLKFVCSHAKQYNVTPILTFDQPLWWKATTIVTCAKENDEVKSLVLMLGGFHTRMSFLGCIGHLMDGSGLSELLEEIYAPNAVVHMQSGKAVARALRGHLLVNSVLHALLMSRAFDVQMEIPSIINKEGEDILQLGTMEEEIMEVAEDISSITDNDIHETASVTDDIAETAALFDEVVGGTVSLEDASKTQVLDRVWKMLEEEKKSLHNQRTASLWLQYISMVDILLKAIKAERIGHWLLHLQTLREMLPFFTASGHNLYAKCVYIYLTKMSKLQQEHPGVYVHFQQGLHVIRRSDRYWAGLPADLVIEQELMRSLKTSGGLTRGRGMSETQQLVCLMSMPICAQVNSVMQELTKVTYSTSEQHIDTSTARQKRDSKDMAKLWGFMHEYNPFDGDASLRSIASGVTAGPEVNVDKAQAVGESIIATMCGKRVVEHSFKKKDQAITLTTRASLKVDNETFTVDAKLLFQRLITVGAKSLEFPSYFKYELCSYPPALFESSGLMLQPNKPVLADAIWSNIESPPIPERVVTEVHYVLDGGALLQRVPWQKGHTYNNICQRYVDYVSKRYCIACIVFDGYSEAPSTKDSSHDRRRNGRSCPEIQFTLEMNCKHQKDDFLSNKANKQRFVNLLGHQLERNGYDVIHAKADADLLIVQTAIESASQYPTILIGEDTDLLVLLLFHAQIDSQKIIFKSEPKQNVTKPNRLWSITKAKLALGDIVCKSILFVHAFLGCDTVSRVFGLGKGVSLKFLLCNKDFAKNAEIFLKSDASKAEIALAGEMLMVCLYKGRQNETLNELRYRIFCAKVASSTHYVEPQSLPPSTSAAIFHSYRCYHQIQVWMGKDLNPEDWGWIIKQGRMCPITTDMDAAPKCLLQIIRCNCKSGCSTSRCSCRKHGLVCTAGCGVCNGVTCDNAVGLQEDANTDNSDEDEL